MRVVVDLSGVFLNFRFIYPYDTSRDSGPVTTINLLKGSYVTGQYELFFYLIAPCFKRYPREIASSF